MAVVKLLTSCCPKLNGKMFLPMLNHVAGISYFPLPKDYSHIEMPEKPKLPILQKVPIYSNNIKPPKMNKCLKYMRGPELYHNALIHEQYGIIALQGGRLKHGHIEMIRNTLGRKIDTKRMFLTWRIDAPWQAVTKKSQGARMGGGKGAIHHYVTPVKANRVIVELAGKCDFEEVRPLLENVAHLLPFKAMAVSHEMLLKIAEEEARLERENLNRYTLKYVLQNNIQNCRKEFRRLDLTYFGKYI